jgi:uncharacterized lipoprotein YmbA
VAGPESPTLGIDRVSLPGYLDREQIATRRFEQRVTYSTTDRWAEPLDQAFERALRDDLASALARHDIRTQSQGATPTYDLSVDVTRFERTGPDHVELSARWVLRANTNVVDAGDQHVLVGTSGTDSNATAAALSEAIARLASQIAERTARADVVAARERMHG